MVTVVKWAGEDERREGRGGSDGKNGVKERMGTDERVRLRQPVSGIQYSMYAVSSKNNHEPCKTRSQAAYGQE